MNFTWPWKQSHSENGSRLGMILGVTAGAMLALTAAAMATRPMWEKWIQEWKDSINDPVDDPETGVVMDRQTKNEVDRMEDEGGALTSLTPAHGFS
jgi:hypothetical protein